MTRFFHFSYFISYFFLGFSFFVYFLIFLFSKGFPFVLKFILKNKNQGFL
jgi:hypothetical protein